MAMSFLTEENSIIAENATNAMTDVPKRLRECSATFKASMKDENISPILDDSPEGKRIRENLTKYCESIDEMAYTLERLHQTITSLVLNSRRAIRTGTGDL